ncbi:MAG: hypothetical protein JST40_08230 [Armatimonadetes bacterium]|nr:hypothetical protein [Armatimonadota bacterium]
MKQLPENPNIEHLKAQAKDLLKTLRASDPKARLHHAQLALAQDYGFASWPKLVAQIEELQLARADYQQVLLMVEQGCRDGVHAARARRILELHPRMAFASPACAAVSLDITAIRELISAENVCDATGSLNAVPTAYAAFSCWAKARPESYAEALKYLLEIGADPNSAFHSPDWTENPLPVLYGAAGFIRSPEATKLLLDAGAKPNDGESMYHAAESLDTRCLQLLVNAGGRVMHINELRRVLDFENPEGLEIMLSACDRPVDSEALVQAIRRGRSQEIIDMLLEAGADPKKPSHLGYTGEQLAFERGLNIGSRDLSPTPEQELVRACWQGDVQSAARLKDHHRNLTTIQRRGLSDALWSYRTELIAAFFAGGFTHEDRDANRGTPLHIACFTGNPEAAREILQHNPPLDDETDNYQAIPMQWAIYASQNSAAYFPDAKWPETVKLLVEAGSPPPNRTFGSEEVRVILRDAWPDLEEEPM